MSAHLAPVPKDDDALAAFRARTEPKSRAEQIKQLQADARDLAADHIGELIDALHLVSRLAGEIADGGDLYAVGARELARRLAEDAGKHALTLQAIAERQ